MLAAPGRPAGDLLEWSAETKLDGWRVQVTIDEKLTVRTRTGRVITTQVPELRALADLGCPAVLDGELVAAAGRCEDFYAIAPSSRTRRQALTFVAFDLLWLDGNEVTELAYADRRRLLLDLDIPPPAVVVNAFDGADLEDVLQACEAEGVEGVLLKHRASRYRAGERSPMWRKVKCPSWQAHAQRRRIGRTP